MKRFWQFGVGAFFLFSLVTGCHSGKYKKAPFVSADNIVVTGDTIKGIKTRLDAVNGNIASKGLRNIPDYDKKLLTGYSYGQFYDWDLYFENIYMSYYGVSEYCFTNYEVFFEKQKENGFIARSFGPRPWGKTQHFKPFIAQNILLGCRQEDKTEWLKRHYENLKKYLDHWFSYDRDNNGLCYWSGGSDHSGMDNQVSRCGGYMSSPNDAVDLNCYLVRECQAMAILAGMLEKEEDARHYHEKSVTLKALINKYLWDEESGFYYDRNEHDGTLNFVKGISGFTPLWSGVASQQQADRLVKEHLINKQEFWTPYPVSTYAQTVPDYSVGVEEKECNWKGNVWIPTNYMIFHGLQKYGYDRVAKEIASKTLELVLNQNEVTREFYNAETGKGLGLNPFWGWSVLAYVMPLEFELQYDPTSLENEEILPIIKQQWSVEFSDE